MPTSIKGDQLRIGDNLQVLSIGGKKARYFEITAIDEVFYRTARAALVAGATESFTSISDLDPPVDQIIWIGSIEIDGNVTLQLKQPASTNRWGTNQSPTGGYLVDFHSSIGDGRPLDIWIAEDFPPSIQSVNNTNVSITPVYWFIGKRFTISPLAGTPGIASIVKIAGISD